jgi:hypothetical protein
MTTRAREWAGRLFPALFAVALGLAAAELIGRLRFTDTPYVPGPQIERIQALLAPHPEVGFLWKPGVTHEQGFEIAWRDSEPYVLSTDSWGFLNAPEVVARVAGGEAPDVVGLGDSFLQVATYSFQERFHDDGLFYYSFAMHRHGPPQYNRILGGYAIDLRPKWVLYGISENDFVDTFDFERWEGSDLDWFTFHSGTWCGPPSSGRSGLDRLRRLMPGTWALWRGLRARLWPDPLLRATPDEIHRYVLQARATAEDAGARFMVLLIPEKQTAIRGPTADAARHEALTELLRESGVEIVDLRAPFASVPDPGALFYRRDSHWNRTGQALAAERILDAIHDGR